MDATASKTQINYSAPQTSYRDPLPLAKELWDRIGPRAAEVARSRAFECSSVCDSGGALLWEDVVRLLTRDMTPVPHTSRRLRFGAAL